MNTTDAINERIRKAYAEKWANSAWDGKTVEPLFSRGFQAGRDDALSGDKLMSGDGKWCEVPLKPVIRVVRKMDDEDVWMRAWEVMVKASSNYYSAKTIEKRADDCLAAFKKRFR